MTEAEAQMVDYFRMTCDGAAQHASVAAQDIMVESTRPAVQFRPRVFIDGDRWCALYGEDLQEGCAGFGDSINAAMRDFDANWMASLAPEEKA